MKRNEIVRLEESGRITVPKELLKFVGLDRERVVELHVEKDKLVIKKYSPLRSLAAMARRLALAVGDLSGAVGIICDNGKILSCSSPALKELVGKSVSCELLSIIAAGQPSLINAADGGKLFDLCEDFSFEYRAFAALPVCFCDEVAGSVIIVGLDENSVFSGEEIKILKLAREMLLSALDAENE